MAILDPVKNFAIVTVSTGYDASATSIDLTSGHGAKLPDPAASGSFNLVWWNSTDYPNPSDDPNVEIVRCTARSTDTLTVSRNQESSGASTKNTSSKTYKMAITPTKKLIDDLVSAIQPVSSQFVGRTTLGNNNLFTFAVDFANGRAVQGTSSTTYYVAKKMGTTYSAAPWNFLTNQTKTATNGFMTFEPTSGKFLGIPNSGTVVTRFDSSDDLANETNCSFSGTAITAAGGICANASNVFILENAAGTTVRKYTFSGSTLTHVSNITLDNAVTTPYIFMCADATYLYTISGRTGAGGDDQIVAKYLISTGARQSGNYTIIGEDSTFPQGLAIDTNGVVWVLWAIGDTGEAPTAQFLFPITM